MTADSTSAQRRKRRRAALRHAMFTRAPVRLSRGRLNRVRPAKDFALTYRTIELPQLPDGLCGLRITHLSDPHVGELITPGHLPHIVDAANAFESDIIAVTGDFIDFSNAYLPEVIEAIQRLEAPLGVWLVLGNHDYLDNPGQLKQAFQAAGLNLLLNDARRLEFHGHPFALAGIDWAERPEALRGAVDQAADATPAAEFSILLAHHPHAFDPACKRGFDLTLAGHTHGGQLLLSDRRGRKGSIGLANLGFRYTRGLYARGNHRLFVSSGVGSWFPLRFRCPAEITSLELQTTY